jgi:hypothetical protein
VLLYPASTCWALLAAVLVATPIGGAADEPY